MKQDGPVTPANSVPKDGLEETVTSVMLTLDLQGNVTPALLDGLDSSVTIVDSVSSLRVTALNVSRMADGLEQ